MCLLVADKGKGLIYLDLTACSPPSPESQWAAVLCSFFYLINLSICVRSLYMCCILQFISNKRFVCNFFSTGALRCKSKSPTMTTKDLTCFR